MEKIKKRLIYVALGIGMSLAIIFSVLLLLGFRFTSKDTINKSLRDNTVIQTDDFDFYLTSTTVDEEGNDLYADLHVAVKKYGLLYKQVNKATSIDRLVTRNGDTLGLITSYQGKNYVYYFINWINTVNFNTMTSKWNCFTDHIVINGRKVELYKCSYFKVDVPIEELQIEGIDVQILKGTGSF